MKETMSKRKREADEEGEAELKKGGDIKISREINETPDREQVYREAYDEILRSQEAIKRAKNKMKQLSECVQDYFTLDGQIRLDKASRNLQQSLASLRQSERHWVGLLCIPEVPLRQILKYLSFEDKSSLRLSSRSHMQAVDWFDADYKTVKIDFDRELTDTDFDMILGTGKEVQLKCTEYITDHDIRRLPHMLDRLVGLVGPVPLIDKIEVSTTLEKITVRNYSVAFMYLPPTIINFSAGLKEMDLEDLSLSLLDELHDFCLPHLERLGLVNVTGFSGLVPLLRSCSESLQQLSFRDMSRPDLTLLLDAGITLDRLKKISAEKMNRVSGLFALLKIASKNLKELSLRKVQNKINNNEPEQLDFDLPRLETLHIDECCSVYLSILTCPAPDLISVSLPSMDLTSLTKAGLNISKSVVKLSLDFQMELRMRLSAYSENHAACKKLVASFADRVQELSLTNLFFQLRDDCSVPPFFPKLEVLDVSLCTPNLVSDLVNRSPQLRSLTLDTFNGVPDQFDVNKTVEKLDIIGKMSTAEVQVLFSNFSQCLKEISFASCSTIFDAGDVLEDIELKLRKISLNHRSKLTGYPRLLDACSSTLEKLEILNNSVIWRMVTQDKQAKEMKVLREIVIQYDSEKKLLDATRIGSDDFHHLLGQCRGSLEKLVLDLPKDQDTNEGLLSTKLDLPKLKILQIHPMPSKQAMKHISSQLPEDVIFWFFPLDYK